MHCPVPGCYVSSPEEPFQGFVPAPLPPQPPVEWSPALRRRFDDALVALGRSRCGHRAAAQRRPAALQLCP